MYPLPQKITIPDHTPNYSFVPEYKNISQKGNFGNADFYELLKKFQQNTDIDKRNIIHITNEYERGFTGSHQVIIARNRFGLFVDEYACLVINPTESFIFTFDSEDFPFKLFVRTITEKTTLGSIGRNELSSEKYLLLMVTLNIV